MNRHPLTALRLGAAAIVLWRLAGAARRRPPISAGGGAGATTLSVVVPARNETLRIGPLLDALARSDDVDEVIVVDDESTDDTAAVAAAGGARVVAAVDRPPGWAGKPWALRRGTERANGEWVVCLDADTRPDPRLPAALVARAVTDDIDLLTVAGRFECPTRGGRWLHAAMLTTLVYRYGPPGARRDGSPARRLANGQCMAFRREPMLRADGFGAVADRMVEDVALARHLASRGWSVAFLDATGLLSVRGYESIAATWRGWGRSIGLPVVEPAWRRLVDVAVLALALPAPITRIAVRRHDLLDIVLLAVRLGTLVGTRRAYDRADAAYWLSPLADGPAVVATAISAARGRQEWRGRRVAT